MDRTKFKYIREQGTKELRYKNEKDFILEWEEWQDFCSMMFNN